MASNMTSWTPETILNGDSTATPDDSTVEPAEKDPCDELNEVDNEVFQIYFYTSLFVTFALCFIVRRKQCCHRCCWNRPGFLQPLDFIDDIGRRWAYAACFVLITYNVLTLFDGESLWNILPKDPEWSKKFGFIRVFNKLFEVMSVCVVYYPLLACINHRRHIAANITGFFYALPWIALHTLIFLACPIQGENFDLSIFLFRIPIYISFWIVLFSYVLDLCLNAIRIHKRRKLKSQQVDSKDLPKKKRKSFFKLKHHLEYTKELLNRQPKEDVESGNVIKRKLFTCIKKAKYEKILGFRYPLRLICAITISLTLQLWFVVRVALAIEVVSLMVCELLKIADQLDFLITICQYISVATILAHVANALSGVLIMIMLVNTLITYKRRWHQLLRGDHSWHMFGATISSPPSTLLNGLKFAGYQVGFLVWGWIVLAMFLYIVLMFFTFAFIIPLRDGVRNWFINMLISIWPTLLLGMIVIPLIQKLVCKFVLLQHRGSTFAIDNRRIYNAASYYFLILNILVGMISCFKRILLPFILGIVFLSRLDQPLMISGYETKDSGYVAFVSMLLVDLYHNHPIVKTFVDLLNRIRADNSGENNSDSIELRRKSRRSKMLRNRWYKMVTLINNPSIVPEYLEKKLKRQNAFEGITNLKDVAEDEKDTLTETTQEKKNDVNRYDSRNNELPQDDQGLPSNDQSNVETSPNRNLVYSARL